MVVPPRTAAPVGECSIVRQYHSEVLINAQTGQVDLSQKQMSGNATFQDLARPATVGDCLSFLPIPST